MTVGITGHQNLGSGADVAWVRAALEGRVRSGDVTHGLTSLAAGADQLFASVLRDHGIPYTAIIPCAGYESTFGPADRRSYASLCDGAARVIRLPYPKPEEAAFWEAGKRLVRMADSVVAVWNGLPAKGLGGTGDVVAFALRAGKPVLHVNPVRHEVTELGQSEKIGTAA